MSPYPKTVCIEVTNNCNMRCSYCLYEHGRETLQIIDDRMIDKLKTVIVNADFIALDGGGEILHNSGTIAVLNQIASIKPVAFTTNGKNLTGEVLNQLPFERISHMHISFDGFNEKIWLNLRRGNDADRVYSAILGTLSTINCRACSTELWVNIVLSTLNIDAVPAIIEKLAERGVRFFHLLHLIVTTPQIVDYSLFNHQGRCNKALAAVCALARQSGITVIGPPLFGAPREESGPAWPYHYPCDQSFTNTFVRSDGTVVACCDPRMVMGNLHEQDFEEIWEGEKYQALRNSVNTSQPSDYCRYCIHPTYSNVDWLKIPACLS